MPDAVSLAIAIAGIAFGVGSLLWARRRVARERERADRAERQLTASGFERTLLGGSRAVRAALQTAVHVRERGLGGLLTSLDELAGWAEVERPDLRRVAARDGTVTIMFSDIEDSTAINERLGDRAWVRLLGVHDRILRDRVAAHDGFVVKSQGDGFMVAFSTPAEAIACASEIQRSLSGGDRRLRKEPLRVRIGIHVGKAVEKNGDLFGRNVAFAARVAAAGEGGQVLVSSATAERVPDLDLVRVGAAELKGLPGEHELFEVTWQPLALS